MNMRVTQSDLTQCVFAQSVGLKLALSPLGISDTTHNSNHGFFGWGTVMVLGRYRD